MSIHGSKPFRGLILSLAIFSLTGCAIVYGASRIASSGSILDDSAPTVAAKQLAPAIDLPIAKAKGEQTVVLAGGCFWGMEAVFEHVKGVSNVVSGFAGGSATTAHYETVSAGATGHAEAVKITYNPAQLSYGQLLQIYLTIAHDPTQLNGQGPDRGTQYRSVIFFANPEQKRIAQAYLDQLNKAHVFHRSIVTAFAPLQGFYVAEDYHQNFVRRHPDYPYVVVHDLPKLERLQQQFPDLYQP